VSVFQSHAVVHSLSRASERASDRARARERASERDRKSMRGRFTCCAHPDISDLAFWKCVFSCSSCTKCSQNERARERERDRASESVAARECKGNLGGSEAWGMLEGARGELCSSVS
jgi:hypothetical protein